MSKLFLEENYEGIEVTLKDKEEKTYDIKSKVLTLEDIEFIEDSDKRKDLSASKQITSILIRIFGKDEKFWKKFTLNLLMALMMKVTEEIKKKPVT